MYIGIDIGGYKTNSVLFDGKKIIKKRKVLTKSMSNKKIMLAQIFDCIDFLINRTSKNSLRGIGIGVPEPTNVTALKDIALGEVVRKKLKIKTKVDNDANCFGLAEAILGAGKDASIVAGLTLGTGIGGTLIINRKIFHGTANKAAEFGHMIIQKDGRKCNCGAKGCLEAYVSARGIVETAKEIGLKAYTPKEISELAKKGNKKAIQIFQITGEYLGVGLANLVNILNPDIIVIGGGISNAGKFFLDSAKKVMQKNIISPLAKNTKITKAKLGEDAGAVGAALLFL